MNDFRYSPDEILQILIDFYNFQSVFDPEVDPGETLTFETTISEWRGICDLVEPKNLAKHYYDLFQLTTPLADLEAIVSHSNSDLKVFCDYLSEHAAKQGISPIMIMGQNCMTASIFTTLINRLQIRGIETENIRPSSKFTPLFKKHGSVLLEEVNKLVPGSLSKFEYRENWIVRTGIAINLSSFLSFIVVPMIWHFHWTLFVPLCIGVIITFIGNKFSPAKEVIGGYNTVRDLILGMQTQANKLSE
jgi:hypothetical protein